MTFYPFQEDVLEKSKGANVSGGEELIQKVNEYLLCKAERYHVLLNVSSFQPPPPKEIQVLLFTLQ